MLILPLHRRLNAANFPYVTLFLILVNALVYFGWQQRSDDQSIGDALAYYQRVDLGRVEMPAYQAWLKERGRPLPAVPADMAAELPPALIAAHIIHEDAEFLAALRADKVITPDQGGYASWRPLRTEFDALLDSGFTQKHLMRFDSVDPTRMFSAMFLHGDAGHLIGNMIFLAVLGLLVEGALGAGLFLALYLLGGMGGQLASLAWHWGETGGGLGASGAIAALMGAFCVVWGMRKVRFFYWFFIFFDYVRAPALLLLPVWLGWELFSLISASGSNISFEAHAAGIAGGALLGWGVVTLGWEKRSFMDEEPSDTRVEARHDFSRAQALLGKLEIPAAKALLAPMLQLASPSLPVLMAWYRCCRYEPGRPNLADALRRVLAYRPANATERADAQALFNDYLDLPGASAPLPAASCIPVAQGWIEIGLLADAERLLRTLDPRAQGVEGLPETWLQLVRQNMQRNQFAAAAAARDYLAAHFPDAPATGKARFLLGSQSP